MPGERPPLTFGRRFAAAIGVLVMLFSGGCALAVLGLAPHFALEDVPLVFGISMIGFLPGLAITLSALYAGRPREDDSAARPDEDSR